jgi:RimJ/RimL family protein N-acetyltransferase
MQPFETQRLLLRPLTLRDLEDLYELYRRPELMRYITGEPRSYAKTRARLLDHIADHERHGFGLCAAICKETGEMIGRCGLEPIPGPTGVEGNIAWLFKRACWGRGLATEFGKEMVAYGFAELGLKRIVATAVHANLASIRIMQKIGMQWVHSTARGVLYEIVALK